MGERPEGSRKGLICPQRGGMQIIEEIKLYPIEDGKEEALAG